MTFSGSDIEQGKPAHLALLEPAVQQVLLVLADDQARQLHRLEGVKLPLLQQRAKVDQQRVGLARLRRYLLEALDGLLRPQSALRTASTMTNVEPHMRW